MSDQYLPTYIDNIDNSISIMNNENAISYYKNNGDINTVSAKNIAHRKIGDNLNLCAFDGSNFNSVISINNSNSNCAIMTNLNIGGNLNINNNLNTEGIVNIGTNNAHYSSKVTIKQGTNFGIDLNFHKKRAQPIGALTIAKKHTVNENGESNTSDGGGNNNCMLSLISDFGTNNDATHSGGSIQFTTQSHNGGSFGHGQPYAGIYGGRIGGYNNYKGELIFYTSNNNIDLYYNSNTGIGTNLNPVMTITDNVGIGVTNPTYKLDIDGDINLTGSIRVNGTEQSFGGGGGEDSITLTGTDGHQTTPTTITTTLSSASLSGSPGLIIETTGDWIVSEDAHLYLKGKNLYCNEVHTSSGVIWFPEGNTFAYHSTNDFLRYRNNNNHNTNFRIETGQYGGSDNSHHARLTFATYSSSQYIQLAGSSFSASSACSGISDDRIKTDEELIVNVTPILLRLRPQKYKKYMGDTIEKVKKQIEENSTDYIIESGLIAQEMFYETPELRFLVNNTIDPNTVDNISRDFTDIKNDPDYSNWPNEISSVNYTGLIPYLIKGFQEQNTIINTQQTEINTLKTENAELKSVIDKLKTSSSFEDFKSKL